MFLKVFHSHCTKTDDPDVMLWLCIRSPGYCSQVVPYAYLGILRSRLPIHKMLQCAALVLPIVLKLCSKRLLLLLLESFSSKVSLLLLKYGIWVLYTPLTITDLSWDCSFKSLTIICNHSCLNGCLFVWFFYPANVSMPREDTPPSHTHKKVQAQDFFLL